MNARVFCGFLLACGIAAHAQTTTRATVQQELGFEQQTGPELHGWFTNPAGTVSADDQVAHSGKWSARLRRDASSGGTFSVMTRVLPVDFAGGTVELRGHLRLDSVTGYAGLWMRQDSEGTMLSIDNMESQHVKGTRDWAEYRISLPINPTADKLLFGVLMEGTGTVWADDLELLVDGKPIAAAKAAAGVVALPEDHEFDAGSKIAITSLSATQIENLATLARVWGFLKYHHPAVTGGQRHWDYDLFRVMPAVLAASDRAQANAAMVAWIDKLGPVAACSTCVKPPAGELQLKPDVEWIRDRDTLGAELSMRLQQAYANRTGKQFFIAPARDVGNPQFQHELAYPAMKFPDAGLQLLALFRWWNIVQYWSPGREVAGQDWGAVLRAYIPKLALAADKHAYQLTLFELIGTLNDTHANMWSALDVRPPTGACWLPALVRWVQNQPVVGRVDAADSGLKAGDVLQKIDGVAAADVIAEVRPYYDDSNEAARMRDIAEYLGRGACAAASLDVLRGGKPVHVEVTRIKSMPSPWHDRPGDTFQMLSPDVAYIKLSSIKAVDVPGYFEKAKNTKGVIIDIRNYPSEFMPFTIGQYLAERPTQFVQFTAAEMANPGAFAFAGIPIIQPGATHYGGKVVVLVDEVSVSQAEYTAMAFRAMPHTTVVGSTTAGADGNVSQIPLPGGQSTMLSGLGVFYPDHRPTQRIGIVPDVVVTPTIEGMAAGKDEVLERAMEIVAAGR